VLLLGRLGRSGDSFLNAIPVPVFGLDEQEVCPPPSDACRAERRSSWSQASPGRGSGVVLAYVQWSICKSVDGGFLGKAVAILDVGSAPA